MTKRPFLIIIIFLFALFSCKKSNSKDIKKIDIKLSSSLDSIIYNNYVNAIENGSTLQYFLVVKIKDLNSGNIREICTKGNFLSGALHQEYNIGYDNNGAMKLHKLLLENKQRYFELKDTSAINNLSRNKSIFNEGFTKN